MKKLLLSSVTIAAALSAVPAKAEGLQLGISGWFAGYGVYNNQDEIPGTSLRSFDLRKQSEIHFTGETTLDNGLTVGVVVETEMDRSDRAGTVEESYAYFSGGWGRFNIGEEDGAAYLLQVAAPSADANIDGLDPEINTFDLTRLAHINGAAIMGFTNNAATELLGYSHKPTGSNNKITYFTPVFSGLQAGISYVPAVSEGDQDGLAGITANRNANWDDAIELAARYEGTFEEIDIALGAGWTTVDREITAAGQEARDVWNVGIDLNWGPFGLGFAYKNDDNGIKVNGDVETFVVGIDYVTGPYTFGASYYNIDADGQSGATVGGGVADNLEVDRWTAGVSYAYGPGMSFRGSVSYIDVETGRGADSEIDGYQVSIGTQIDF